MELAASHPCGSTPSRPRASVSMKSWILTRLNRSSFFRVFSLDRTSPESSPASGKASEPSLVITPAGRFGKVSPQPELPTVSRMGTRSCIFPLRGNQRKAASAGGRPRKEASARYFASRGPSMGNSHLLAIPAMTSWSGSRHPRYTITSETPSHGRSKGANCPTRSISRVTARGEPPRIDSTRSLLTRSPGCQWMRQGRSNFNIFISIEYPYFLKVVKILLLS